MIRPVDARQARAALASKGFEPSTKGNRDHEMYFFFLDGKKTAIFFKVSHGASQVRVDEIQNSKKAMGMLGDDIYRILCCEHDAVTTRRLCEESLARR